MTEKSEKMALSVEQLTSDKKMLEMQVSRETCVRPGKSIVHDAFPVIVRTEADTPLQNGCSHIF